MKIIVGKMYADWCSHCKNLIPSWEEMKNQIKKNKNIQVVDFEASRNMNKLKEFQKTYLVSVQKGYPTLFRIVHEDNKEPQIDYYTGNRDTQSLVNWALHKVKRENVKYVQNKSKKSSKNTKRRKQKKNVTYRK